MNVKKGILNVGLFALLVSMSFANYSIQKTDSSNEEAIVVIGPYLEGLNSAFISEVEALEYIIDISDMEVVDRVKTNQQITACVYTLSGATRLIPPPFPFW